MNNDSLTTGHSSANMQHTQNSNKNNEETMGIIAKKPVLFEPKAGGTDSSGNYNPSGSGVNFTA